MTSFFKDKDNRPNKLFVVGLLLIVCGAFMVRLSLPWGSSPLTGLSSWSLLSIGVYLSYQNYQNNYFSNWSIITLALASRLVLINTPYSDDLYRYIWEGRVVLEGLNPYLISPNSESLNYLVIQFTDLSNIRNLINHPNLPAIYPPVSQYILSFFSYFSHNPQRLQNVFQLIELSLLLGVYKLIKQHNLPFRNLLLYSFNPIILIYLVSEAHLDIIGVSFCVWAYFYKEKLPKLSWFLFGLAVLIKYPLLYLLPALLFRSKDHKGLAFFFAPFLSFIPFLVMGGVWGSLSKFATQFRYNAGPWELLSFLRVPPSLSLIIIIVLLSASIILMWWFESRRYFLVLMSTSLCIWFMPTVHPWYLGLMIPFWCLFPLKSLGYMHWVLPLATIPMFYQYLATGEWIQSFWLSPIIWVPGLILVVYDILNHSRSIPKKSYISKTFETPNISMVIPIKNEETQVFNFLNILINQIKLDQFEHKFEIIFVDGNSTDNTVKLLLENKDFTSKLNSNININVLSHSGGRGPQIDFGIKNSKHDLILITHIDTNLTDFSFNQLAELTLKNPGSIGGACNMKFSPSFKGSKLIEFLNNSRIKWGALAFGDQMMFFKREWYLIQTVTKKLPPLMEDIELSLSLRESGPWLIPNDSITISSRRWLEKGSSQNGKLIIYILIVYMFTRKHIGVQKAANWAKSKYYR
jgi:hypothetical protein